MSCITVSDGVTWECLQGGTGLEIQKNYSHQMQICSRQFV